MMASGPHLFGLPLVINLPAVFIVFLITAVLVIGIKESSNFNTVMVIIKLIVVLFFIVSRSVLCEAGQLGAFCAKRLEPIMTSAAIIFFAYIGFDAISTAAEETRIRSVTCRLR